MQHYFLKEVDVFSNHLIPSVREEEKSYMAVLYGCEPVPFFRWFAFALRRQAQDDVDKLKGMMFSSKVN